MNQPGFWETFWDMGRNPYAPDKPSQNAAMIFVIPLVMMLAAALCMGLWWLLT